MGQIVAGCRDIAQDPAMEGPHDPQFTGGTILHGADSRPSRNHFASIEPTGKAAERRLVEQDTAIRLHDARIGCSKINREIGFARALKQSSHPVAVAVAAREVSQGHSTS